MQGDANTQFFHQFINGRRKKKTIAYLENGGEEIRGQTAISAHIVDYYKDLFGHNEPCNMHLKSDFWLVDLKISDQEGVNLVKPFSLEEIKEVVMGMGENSAPSPNGYGVVFFKKFWEYIKDEMGNMFTDFYNGKLDIKRLNYGVITLVPKLKEANNIKHLDPFAF